MSVAKLRKKLKNDPKFMPFSECYELDSVTIYLSEVDLDEDNFGCKTKALSTPIFNQYFKTLKDYFNAIINRNGLSRETFLELIIALSNRDFYLITIRARDSYNSKSEFNFNKMVNSSLQSSILEMGTINAQASLEASHDGLNAILNFTNKAAFINRSNESLSKKTIDDCFKLLGFANVHTVVKSAYDLSIWEDYDLKYDKSKSILRIKCPHGSVQLLNRIGEYRLERNLFSGKILALSALQEKNDFYNIVNLNLLKKRKAKRLNSVIVNDAEIKYKLAVGFEKKSIEDELLFYSDIITYYPFLGDEELPKMDNMRIFDVFTIYSEIKYLFQKVFELEKVELDDVIKNTKLFSNYIKKNDLIKYIFLKTKYSANQINQVLDLFIQNKGHFNLWERSLIQLNDKLVPIMLPLITPNSLRIVDYWLEAGGYDLDSRGVLFEKYIKNELLNILNKKGYEVFIPSKNTFRSKNGTFEEIDLILELKNTLVIAEVKCIKYPFDSRDYYNMHKRLKKAALQVKRKTQFLRNNHRDFKKEINLSKQVVNLIITNYPIFSAIEIEGAIVTDLALIDNYFNTGSFKKAKMIMDQGRMKNEELIDSSIEYYINEDELSNNLLDFFKNPIPIKEVKDNLYVEEKQISLPDAKPKIKLDFIQQKDSNLI